VVAKNVIKIKSTPEKNHVVAKNVCTQIHHEQNFVLAKPFQRKIHSGEKPCGCKECHIAVEHVTTTLFTTAPKNVDRDFAGTKIST